MLYKRRWEALRSRKVTFRNYRRKSRSGENGGAHHLLELVEIDAAIVVGIDGPNHAVDIVDHVAFHQAEFSEDDLKLLGGDVAVAVLVEHLEGLPQVRLLLLLFLALDEAEVGVAQALVEAHEIVVGQALVPGADVRLRHRLQLLHVRVQAQQAQRLADLAHRDHAVAVLVEHVEDAAEAERVQALAPEAERGRGRGEGDLLRSHYHPRCTLRSGCAWRRVFGIRS